MARHGGLDLTHARVVILLDLEGTVCNNGHRVELYQAQEWDEYAAFCKNDIPYTDVMDLLNNLCEDTDNVDVIVISDRSDEYLMATIDWFVKWGEFDVKNFYMRSRYDMPKTKEPILKLELFEKMKVAEGYPAGTVFIALDDKDDVCEAYRNAGISCWQVRNGVIS